MLKLSYKMIISRKGWLFFLVTIFSLIISSFISTYTASTTINASLQDQSFEQYGRFSGVLYNSLEEKENLRKYITSIGQFVMIDTLRLPNDKPALIGWADEEFVDLSHLNFVDGRFPAEPNEVAIESYYLSVIDSTWEIGETRTIIINNISIELLLVGIVENYSSRWTVEKIHFPNLFVSESSLPSEKLIYNYLLGYDPKISIDNNFKQAKYLIDKYDGNGFINDKLLYKGLRSNSNITIISFLVRIIILLVSSFAILTILSYYTTNQMSKYAVLKVVGCTDSQLFMLAFFQTTIIYALGSLFSIPLIMTFHHFIIKHTYSFENLNYNNSNELIIGALVWLFLIYAFIILLSYAAIRKQSRNSIRVNLNAANKDSFLIADKLNQLKYFSIKQLLIQFLSSPKNMLLSLATLTFSMLVIFYSFTLANESAGIWNTKIDFFVTAREMVSTKQIDNKAVVITDGGIFFPDEVREIENLHGIKLIDKEPFMFDVFPSIKKEILEPSLGSWIENSNNHDYNDEVLLQNVNYVLKTEEEIINLYSGIDKSELNHSIIIHAPGLSQTEGERLIGENIVLTKMIYDGDAYYTNNWDFNVLDVINTPYQIKLDNEDSMIKNGITVILTEQTAIDYGITHGYKDLVIYLEEGLSADDTRNIYNKVYALTLGVPGSMFQYVPELIHDFTRITDYLDVLSRMTFYISMVMTFSSIYIIIYGKYQSLKKYWGVYRTLGMSTNAVFFYLLMEAIVLFGASSVLSSLLYFIYLSLDSTDYPTMYYVRFMITTIVSTFALFVLAALVIKHKVKQDSIASLLRIVE